MQRVRGVQPVRPIVTRRMPAGASEPKRISTGHREAPGDRDKRPAETDQTSAGWGDGCQREPARPSHPHGLEPLAPPNVYAGFLILIHDGGSVPYGADASFATTPFEIQRAGGGYSDVPVPTR